MAIRKKKPVAKATGSGELSLSYEPLAALLQRKAPRNAKKHDVDGVAAAMNRFGYNAPITIDETTGLLVAGHGRIETLAIQKANGAEPPIRVKVDEATGDWLVPVLRGISFSSPEEAEAALLADNRLGESAGYDDALLADMVETARGTERGLEGLGWSEEQATDLISSIRDATAGAEVVGPSPEDRTPPEDFASHDASTKETTHCPRCGYPVVTE